MATITAAAGGGVWTTGATWVGGIAPTAADDARLDATSGNVSIGASAACRSLDCNSYTGTLSRSTSGTLSIGDGTAGAGNIALRFAPGMTYTATAATHQITFVSTAAATQTVDFAGKQNGHITFNGAGGSWQLTGDATTVGTLTITAGTVDVNGQTVTAGAFNAAGATARTVTLGPATINLTGTGTVWSTSTVTNLTWDAAGATINLTAVSASSRTMAVGAGGVATLAGAAVNYTVAGSSGALIFSGAPNIGTLTVSDASGSKTVQFPASVTTTIGTFAVNGGPGRLITVRSTTSGTRATLSKSSGVVSVDYLTVQDTAASGGATWYAGANSSNGGNNTGWIFAAQPVSAGQFFAVS